jgi:hypothetical protein
MDKTKRVTSKWGKFKFMSFSHIPGRISTMVRGTNQQKGVG